MFECRACSRRFFQSLGESAEFNSRTLSTTLKRSVYTASRSTSRLERSSPSRTKAAPQRWADSPQAQARRGEVRKALKATESDYEQRAKVYAGKLARSRLQLSSEQEKADREEKDLRIELRWLGDPLKLSDHIDKLLRHQNWDKALALVRLAERGAAHTVSWNHLLNYQMKTGQVKAAIKLFNEMKKRAQKPDPHTFTILLRGLADYAHYPNAVGTALQLYHSMSAENSKVQANIIHTNALLRICSRAGDLESMWDIASKLPERGSYAANAWTFTTFLQAMREKAILSSNASEPDIAALKREEMVVEGRKLWAVIVTRWRQGDMMLDEDLVCAMGRLLLVGSRPRDWDDVLSLLQQSMAIPRQVPALGTQARKDEGQVEIRTQSRHGQIHVRAKSTPTHLQDSKVIEDEEEDDERPGIEFADTYGLEKGQKVPSASSLARARSRGTSPYAQPGNNTLSLVLDATLKTIAVDAGLSYWRLLTNPDGQYVIMPDSDNIHMLLRLLRQSRNSTAATNILQHDMRELRLPYMHKTFRIAMSACVRDSTDRKVLDNAEKVLDIMVEKYPEDLDLNVMTQYIDVAAKHSEYVAKNEKASDKHKSSGQGTARFDVGVIVRAIDRLTPLAFDALKRAKLNLKPISVSDDVAEMSIRDSNTQASPEPVAPKPNKSYNTTTTKPTKDREAISELERGLIRLHDKVIDAVREARAASKDAEYAPWGITEEIVERYKTRSKRLGGAVSKEANRRNAKDIAGRERRARDANEAKIRRNLKEMDAKMRADSLAALEGQQGGGREEQQEEEFGKRKWTPGLKPKSGIARTFAMG